MSLHLDKCLYAQTTSQPGRMNKSATLGLKSGELSQSGALKDVPEGFPLLNI